MFDSDELKFAQDSSNCSSDAIGQKRTWSCDNSENVTYLCCALNCVKILILTLNPYLCRNRSP